jgi:hypothetical protein
MTSTPLRLQCWTADEAFKVYMTRKTQEWFRRWGCDAAAASPGPGAAPNGAGSGAGAATPARSPAPDASDDEGALITGGGDDQTTSPTVTLETLSPAGRA